jgi:hypothetical protein
MYLKKEHLLKKDESYILKPGPEGYVPPAAASMGIELPDPGEGLAYGRKTNEDAVMEEIAKQMLTRKNPTIFPGPLVLWAWNEHAKIKGQAVLELANEIPDVMIIPMPDYRPKYPKIEPEEEINPNHPNLTIWHNKIEVCIFIGVHCHYANLTLKMIRAGTNCLTAAVCAEQGHEDAMLTIRDSEENKIRRLSQVIRKVRESMGIPAPTRPPYGGGKREIVTPEEWAKIREQGLAMSMAGAPKGMPLREGQMPRV